LGRKRSEKIMEATIYTIFRIRSGKIDGVSFVGQEMKLVCRLLEEYKIPKNMYIK
jgi:hypothetical protein